MNDTITKSKRISFKDLGIKSPIAQGVSPEYWAKKKAQQERWAKEDAKNK